MNKDILEETAENGTAKSLHAHEMTLFHPSHFKRKTECANERGVGAPKMSSCFPGLIVPMPFLLRFDSIFDLVHLSGLRRMTLLDSRIYSLDWVGRATHASQATRDQEALLSHWWLSACR